MNISASVRGKKQLARQRRRSVDVEDAIDRLH